ncbi:MAG TPA: helix-turn-helix domain-containing protein [Chloroflexota bacterium]|nr:helix-turn-helix domain-containing protein [Chloroflexota bacterium]
MPSPTAIDRGTLTIDEVAARLGIDRGTAYRLAKSDSLPAPVIRLGKRMVIGRTALERVLAGEPVASPKAGGGDDAAA